MGVGARSPRPDGETRIGTYAPAPNRHEFARSERRSTLLDIFSSAPDLSIQVHQPTFAPGAPVEGVLSVRSDADRDVARVLVVLVCEEEYEYRVRQRSGKTSHVVSRRETHTLFEQEHELSGPTTLPADQPTTFGFALALPEAAPPSYGGEILTLRWTVRARLDLPRAPDARTDTPLSVLLPPGGPYPQPRHAADREEHDECDLSISLEGTAWALGSEVSGVVRIEPKQAFAVQEVRAELRRVEIVPAHLGNERDERGAVAVLSPARELDLGLPVELPFRLPLPSGALPSVSTPHGVAYWEVDVVLARKLRGDLHLRRGVHAYNLVADDAS